MSWTLAWIDGTSHIVIPMTVLPTLTLCGKAFTEGQYKLTETDNLRNTVACPTCWARARSLRIPTA